MKELYPESVLKKYNKIVLKFSNRFVWKCPTEEQLAFYNENAGAGDHLDVGVGTGYFLDRCSFPASPRIALLDLEESPLKYASSVIKRYNPAVHQGDILKPLDIKEKPFSTIGLNYVLHCLPGNMKEKSVCLDHLSPYLKKGGMIFGTTLLSGGVERSLPAKLLMKLYNGKLGFFHNTEDDLETLEGELEKRFTDVKVRPVGCGVLFQGRKK